MREIRVWNRCQAGIPEDAVYVGRPTKWGNPFSHKDSRMPGVVHVPTRAEAIARYREWIYADERGGLRVAMQRELRGKDLICWCAPAACHAEIIAEIANAPLCESATEPSTIPPTVNTPPSWSA